MEEQIILDYLHNKQKWVAAFESYDGSGPIGFGKTEDLAIEDLFELIGKPYVRN